MRRLFSWGPDLAGDNYHDQENAQISYFPMGKIKKEKQSLQRRELVNGSEIRTYIEMGQQTGMIFYCGKKEDDSGETTNLEVFQ